MTYFPNSILPKRLIRESAAEVDNCPQIVNAKDYNRLMREIIAIEKYLVGEGSGTNSGLIGLPDQITDTMKNIANNGLFCQMSGVVSSGSRISIPVSIVSTTTTGNNASAATTINVTSTSNFPTSGTITKFNAISSSTATFSNAAGTTEEYKNYSFNEFRFQEQITYTGKTNTSFTGCSRVVVDAQTETAPSVVIAGKASIALYPIGWDIEQNEYPSHFYLESTAMLVPTGKVYKTNATLHQVDKSFAVGYILTIVGATTTIRMTM